MDLTLYLVIAILMAIATFFIGKFLGDEAKQAILYLAGLAVVLPIIVVTIAGMLGMLQSTAETAEEIASSTIQAIVNYTVGKLPYIVISDVAGIIVGSVVALFTGREH